MRAPALRELQRLFWHSLADHPGGASLRADLVDVVEPSVTLDRRARLQIYADAYFCRLRDVLREDFPKLAALIGPERFERLVLEYLRSHPSEHPSVRYVGRMMSDFLSRRTDVPAFLADLSRLEWARVEVFDAPDGEPIDAATLRRVPADRWPAMRFRPIPALEIVDALWPVHRLWAGEASDLPPARTTIMVWRARDFSVLHSPLDQRGARALRLLIAGEPFAAMCEAFEDLAAADAARESAALLARWLEDGIIDRAE